MDFSFFRRNMQFIHKCIECQKRKARAVARSLGRGVTFLLFGERFSDEILPAHEKEYYFQHSNFSRRGSRFFQYIFIVDKKNIPKNSNCPLPSTTFRQIISNPSLGQRIFRLPHGINENSRAIGIKSLCMEFSLATILSS